MYKSAIVSYITKYNEVFDEKTRSSSLIVFDPNGPTKQQCGIVNLTVYDIGSAAKRLADELLKEVEEQNSLQKKYPQDTYVREKLILLVDRINFYSKLLSENLPDKGMLV